MSSNLNTEDMLLAALITVGSLGAFILTGWLTDGLLGAATEQWAERVAKRDQPRGHRAR